MAKCAFDDKVYRHGAEQAWLVRCMHALSLTGKGFWRELAVQVASEE